MGVYSGIKKINVRSYDFKRRNGSFVGLKRYRRNNPTFIPLGKGRFRMGPLPPRIRAAYNYRQGGFLGQELKFYDTALIGSALTAPTDSSSGEHDPSATIVLNSVVQGDGESQRDGRRITMKSIFVRGQVIVPVQTNQTGSDPATTIFIALVLDTQTNGATIASENVFDNQSQDALLAASGMRNLQFSTRFRVLKSLRFTLQNPNLSWDGTNMEVQGIQRPFQLGANLGNLGVVYNGTTESVANITDNSLHIIAYCNSTTLAPTINYNARLRFMG